MKNYLTVLGCLALLGCGAEQRPAVVVAANPTTYTPVLALNTTQSRVATRMQKSASKPVWIWPTQGNVARMLSQKSKKPGLEILGLPGTPIVAAADGDVIYSGNSLKGYGNLIIIKHQKNFLTAYAHNKKNMVKEGDKVIMGQRIAEMGKTGTDTVKLHFEMRQNGEPIDPRILLPRK